MQRKEGTKRKDKTIGRRPGYSTEMGGIGAGTFGGIGCLRTVVISSLIDAFIASESLNVPSPSSSAVVVLISLGIGDRRRSGR